MEHTVGQYLVLLSIACAIGIAVKWITTIPYTIALTLVGLLIAFFHMGPEIQEIGFSKELIFFVLLPPLLFQGAFHMQLDRLFRLGLPIILFATVGVVLSTLIIGFSVHWLNVFESLQIAILFGALICTTDPVSVLAIFRQCEVPSDLKYLVEGESLFNDGTGVVVFGIVLSLIIVEGSQFTVGHASVEFLRVILGGTVVGVAIGAATYFILRSLTDHLLENAICLLACYASFFVAEHFHFSGVIATVWSGLLLGNYGRRLAMSGKTTETVETFFETIDFLINSVLFILIGLELQAISADDIRANLSSIAIAVAVVLIARALTVYPLFFVSRPLGHKFPANWSHVLYWGGLRGSIPIALLLGLPADGLIGEHRSTLLVVGFGVVCFSLIVQGLTMKPLIALLNIRADEDPPADPAHHQEGLV